MNPIAVWPISPDLRDAPEIILIALFGGGRPWRPGFNKARRLRPFDLSIFRCIFSFDDSAKVIFGNDFFILL